MQNNRTLPDIARSAIEAMGGTRAAAAKLSASPSTVQSWKVQPTGIGVKWVQRVSKLTSIAPVDLRPDIFRPID